MCVCNPGHRVSRPRGTGSVGCGVGEGKRGRDSVGVAIAVAAAGVELEVACHVFSVPSPPRHHDPVPCFRLGCRLGFGFCFFIACPRLH